MYNRFKSGILAVIVVALSASAATAQNTAPRALPEGANELIAEMTQIQNQLAPMQERAMQEPDLLAAGQSLGESIMKAMEEVEPETPTLIARLNELGSQVQAAQAAQDEAQVRALVTEAGEIDQILQIAQETAVGRPDILALVTEYEVKVHTRMRTDNPDAAALLTRLDTLNEQLASLLQLAR